MNICRVGEDKTVVFAGEELKKYLEEILSVNLKISIEGRDRYNSKEESLWIGTFDSFKACFGDELEKLGEADDSGFDDAVYVNVNAGRGIIAGLNPRSVLLGVYRFLSEIGCRWVRPGADGEYIPQKNIGELRAKISEKPSYKHRGICIEGANSYENIRDIIDWAPKVGFNSYFFQFREAYTFFERWYSHTNNPTKKPEPFSIEKAREFLSMAEGEMDKRGLIYHAVGHGWTCEPLGIPGLGWENKEYELSPEVSQFLALVNGKREIWKGVALNTNLCYSNPEVRHLMNQEIAEYLKKHPDVDVLHYWLADASNNQCECDECKKANPSDFYVRMLNELDELLTQKGIQTKIVFLIYVDLLWAPLYEKFKNPDRFILMFAPITRTYSYPFSTDEALPEPAPYDRNKLKFPSSVKENLAFLKSWQQIFKGDSFDFDYHFMWDHYYDPGYYQIADLLCKDIRNLKNIGLNGYMSCQTQRAFFPTGLGMFVMGQTLWNDKLDFENMAQDYFDSAFGEEGQLAREYLAQLSQLFDPPYLRGEKVQEDPEAVKRLMKISAVIKEFCHTIERNMGNKDGCRAKSWYYLKLHAELCAILAKALAARAEGDLSMASGSWSEVKKIVQEKEDDVQPVLDVYLFIRTVERKWFSK